MGPYYGDDFTDQMTRPTFKALKELNWNTTSSDVQYAVINLTAKCHEK